MYKVAPKKNMYKEHVVQTYHLHIGSFIKIYKLNH